MTAGMVVFLAFPQWLLGIFNASEELLEIGVPALRIICTCFLFAALGIVASTLFQACGPGHLQLDRFPDAPAGGTCPRRLDPGPSDPPGVLCVVGLPHCRVLLPGCEPGAAPPAVPERDPQPGNR